MPAALLPWTPWVCGFEEDAQAGALAAGLGLVQRSAVKGLPEDSWGRMQVGRECVAGATCQMRLG